MPPGIATVVYALLILGLFWLDLDQKAQTSGALWIPVIWLWLACSRPVGQWLQGGKWTDLMNSPGQLLLEGSPIDRLVYTGLLVIGLMILINRKRQLGMLLRENGPILLFFLYCAVSLIWSDYPDVAFKRWIKALGDFVMVLVVFSDRQPSAAVRRLLARTTYTLIPLSILLIKYYPALGKAYGPWGGTYYTGVTPNKNNLGAVCLLLGLGSVWRFLAAYQSQEVTDRARQMIAQGIVLAMVLWLFQITNSVTSLATFLMASALLLATNFRAVIRKPAVVHLLMASMLAVSASVLLFGVNPDVLATMGRDPTLTGRTEVWGDLLSLVQNPLFGTGFESFWLGPRLERMWSLYWWHPSQAHNGYLEVFLNLGWVGVALLVVIIATGYRTVFCAWRSNVSTGSLKLAYFSVGVVYNLTEAALFKMMAPVWIFLLFAILSVPAVSYSVIQPRAQNLSPDPGAPTCQREQSIFSEERRSFEALQ